MGAISHDTLCKNSTTCTEAYSVPNATRAVHINLASAVQCGIAEHIITAKVHLYYVDAACPHLLSYQSKRYNDKTRHQRVALNYTQKGTWYIGANCLIFSANGGFQTDKCYQGSTPLQI